MTSQDKETLKLTLMAFENNTSNIKNIRNSNDLSLTETQSLLHIEQKMYEVKDAIMNVLQNKKSEINHLSIISEIESNRFQKRNYTFLHDNVD